MSLNEYIPAGCEHLVTPKGREYIQKVYDFVEKECIPLEPIYLEQFDAAKSRWEYTSPITEELKAKAQKLGLWNLFFGKEYSSQGLGANLTNLEYSIIAQMLGKCAIASEATNCAAPDTGNMEVLAKYGNAEQKKKWLEPLLRGEIRSAFAMTERFISSSDATNIQTSMVREGDEYVINGHKWWISGAGNPRCKVHLVCGKTDTSAKKYRQQSLILVPADTPGVKIIRPMHVFGYDDAGHGGHMEVIYENVRVPVSNIVLGEGRGFEIMQGRLGPGRIHHCMRTIGAAERALELMILRATDQTRKTFGKHLYEHGVVVSRIAQSRMDIELMRQLVLEAAIQIDKNGAKKAMRAIGIAKVVVPTTALQVIDRAQQLYGAEGISQDSALPFLFAHVRTLRYADGPDEVHTLQIGRNELIQAPSIHAKYQAYKDRQEAEQEKRKSKL